ncbi:neurotrimin-like [Pollicipes pollicipes]|uniref:neurotrimin-like n=1 Tax=Pollicipes pollicipes TaxID=41117 RepID=UPI0018853749|nr:neurotrimin-like [Pollicipes pollicipes]XP_037080308.1 neurotrimin-like [Pollicipes pollicipes]
MGKIHLFVLNCFFLLSSVAGLKPVFVKSLGNVTVPEGREATFTCVVHHLGGHKVAWIKSDSKAILAIHNQVITHFDRLTVIHNDHNTWTLILRDVRQSDRGPYMCQVNTDPMRYQVGHLEVVVPPDIVTSETSSDLIIPEGGSARLQCKANGHPPPTISWQREDGQEIVLRQGRKLKVANFSGEVLQLDRVTRSEMGVYLCIANNGIPPPVSKRTMITVNFPPMLEVSSGLVGAPVGSEVSMACRVEASPKAIFYWSRENGEMILTGARHQVSRSQSSPYRYNMSLAIRRLAERDFGTYHCIAKNSMGEAEGAITLHKIHLPSSARPMEVFTEPSDLLNELAEFEQSGDLPPFGDDEDFLYGRTDEPARPEERAPERTGVVLTELSKSVAPQRAATAAAAVHPLLLAVLGRAMHSALARTS